ncbi:sporulation protein YqfD [uncultured Clostridium sp.]|uniref:sporulation protein YqfD n=1 Tax=uncultured Clostridium sp. TaxID=59620 RepID=UPI002639D776|nr:sporulation protein YqfD [uncultured Clostridium sp.]
MKNAFMGEAIITIEVKLFKREGLLNVMRNKDIIVRNIINIDAVTIRFDIFYKDYGQVKRIIKKLGGKIKIFSKGSQIKMFIAIKNSICLFAGIFVFFLGLYIMSSFIWRIEIESKNYLPPYEIRNYLFSQGIKPGVSKSSIDVYELEKKIENNIDEIMWINIRIEGATMKVKFEEKKATLVNDDEGSEIGSNKVATMNGTVKRVYTSSGTAIVKEGDIVKKGDVLIKGEQVIKDQIIDGEDIRKPVKPDGSIVADTFYEKIVELKVKGIEEVRTGGNTEEIYLNLFGKKIYLKKANKDFASYDKIEKTGSFVNRNIYYEKEQKEIAKTEQEIIDEAVSRLKKATEKEISKQAIIVDTIVETEDLGDGSINLKVLFVVEQDIVSF